MGTNDLSLGPSACPFLQIGRRSKHFDMDGKLSVSLNTITLAATETRESVSSEIKLTTNSSYLTGTNLTYSGARGSSALKIGVTFSGLGGAHGLYIAVATSGAQVSAGYGVIGVKCVVTNTAALSNGVIYAGQFIAKHAHASNVMTAEASLIGIEAWAYISSTGPARTAMGANFAIHNECTTAIGAGSVHRVIQVVCDLASGAQAPTEGSGICIWNMAGAWDNAIKIVTSSTGFTTILQVDAAVSKVINVDDCEIFADVDATPSGSTSKNVAAINVTDSNTQSTGYARALYLNYTTSGAKTGGEVNVLGIDLSITANMSASGYAYGISIYTSISSDRTVGFLAPISIYMDNSGAGAGGIVGIDIGINQTATPTAAGRFAFMRLRGHNATNIPDHAFLLEGNFADALFGFEDGGQNAPCIDGTSGGDAKAGRIKITVNGAARYLYIYSN